MANLEAQPKWSSVRLLEAHELARGGLNGNMNEQAKALAERTEFLNQGKASKSEIVQGIHEFDTYALFDAAKSTLPLNCTVVIGEANTTGTGQWGIGNNSWNGTVLKKSSFDPVLNSSKDATKKMVTGAKNYFDLAYLLNANLYAPGGTVEKIITSETVKYKYTQTANSGVNGIGFTTNGVLGSTVSATIDLSKVDISNVNGVYISQWNSSGNLSKNITLENIGNNIFSVQNAAIDSNATFVRLFVRTNNIVDHVIDIENIDLVFDAYSRYRDDTSEKARLLNSNNLNLIATDELSALTPLQVTNTSQVLTSVNDAGDLIATVIKSTNATHHAGTKIDVANLNRISFGVWVKTNPEFLNVQLWRNGAGSAHQTLSTPLYSKDGWDYYASFGIDVSAFETYEFRVRFGANAVDALFKNPVFTTNLFSANWVQQILSEKNKIALTEKAIEAISPLIPDSKAIDVNFIPLDELIGLTLPSHSSNTKDVLVFDENGKKKYQWKASSAPTVSSLGFFINKPNDVNLTSVKVRVKNTINLINVQLQQLKSDGSQASIKTLTQGVNDGNYTEYFENNLAIHSLTARFRLFIRMTGAIDEVYEFTDPILTFNTDSTEINPITAAFIEKIIEKIPEQNPSESVKEQFNNIAHSVAWIKNPLIHSTARLKSDGTIQDTFDPRYLSIWGSSSAAGIYSKINTFALNTLGCESTFNGGKGGESTDLISARMGARPCRIAFLSGSIPASGSVEVQHSLGLGFGLANLQTYSGEISVYGVKGTLSYDASVDSNLKFTRTTSGETITVPSDMFFDFIPDFDKKFLKGYGIIWTGKNDIGWGNQYGTEELLQRTIEMYSQYKSMFKRVLVLDHWANTTWDGEKWMEVQRTNSMLKQYFGEYLISVNDYIMSSQVWTDTGIIPTADDLTKQAKRLLPSSLSADGQHLLGVVYDQIISKLILPKMLELGWI